MGFKRAQWHSGLTYQRTCDECKTVLQYTDYSLDFRPWYADGFVYCPRCKTPLRHNESYAINAPEPAQPVTVPAPAPAPAPAAAPGGATPVTCPMPGSVLGVKVNVGDTVTAGQTMFVIEAMKMENEIVAPVAGKVASINVKTGDAVDTDQVMGTLN